jgi:hypothetical protein
MSTKQSTGFLMLCLLMMFSNSLPTNNLSQTKQTITWKLADTAMIGKNKAVVLGAPQIVHDDHGGSLLFDGIDDGLIVPVNPLKGWKKFTIEMLFRPAASDSLAPRLMHIQDVEGNRCTIELRLTSEGYWYPDTFLKSEKNNSRLTLIDSSNLHPIDNWYWVALVYDGRKMIQYVNAKSEKEGVVSFLPMITGQTSLGVRLNRVNWFKGQIHEVRFHSVALKKKYLQRQ